MYQAIYHELGREISEHSRSKGFIPVTWDNAGTKLSSIADELVELEEALETNDTRKQQAETADIAIYTLLMLEHLRGPREWSLRGPRRLFPSPHVAPETLTKPLRKQWAAVFRYWRLTYVAPGELATDEVLTRRKDVCVSLELLLKHCIELSACLEFDLAIAIRAKLAVNRKRPKLHQPGRRPDT